MGPEPILERFSREWLTGDAAAKGPDRCRPATARPTRTDVAEAFDLPMETGCMGCTVCRSVSFESQVLSTAEGGMSRGR